MKPDSAEPTPVRVWDLPTRIFHWTLVLALLGLVITGKVGGNALEWHMRLGMLVFILLGFRLVWGLVGGYWSRFARFIYAPATLLRYLRGQVRPADHFEVGHNPLGSLSVFAMLGLLCLQVATGLLADDEIATTGPLNKLVSNATGLLATAWHKGPGQGLILTLVALHVAAILYYRFGKGKDLIGAMWRGDKHLPSGVPGSADTLATRLKALVLLLVWAAMVAWVIRQGG